MIHNSSSLQYDISTNAADFFLQQLLIYLILGTEDDNYFCMYACYASYNDSEWILNPSQKFFRISFLLIIFHLPKDVHTLPIGSEWAKAEFLLTPTCRAYAGWYWQQTTNASQPSRDPLVAQVSTGLTYSMGFAPAWTSSMRRSMRRFWVVWFMFSRTELPHAKSQLLWKLWRPP